MENNNNSNGNQQYPRIKDLGSSLSHLLPEDVDGYVIFNAHRKFLNKELHWTTYDAYVSDRQGYVFTELRVCSLLQEAERDEWEIRPVFVGKATWYSVKNRVLYEAPVMTLEQFWAQVKHGE